MKTVYKISLARLVYKLIVPIRRLLGKGTTANITRNGIRWALDLREGIDFAIYLQGQFEPSTAKALSKLIKPNQVVLDIGANIGAHTLHLARLVGPSGIVIAFEPTQYAYRKLLNNLSLNPTISDRVIAEQIMLGQEDIRNYKTEIYSSWTIVGDAERHPKHLGELKSTEGCDKWRLDSYLAQHNYTNIALIKLDVDGYECEVLGGAVETLSRDRPIICCELAPYVLAERGASIDELIKILATYDYRIVRESNGEELPMAGGRLTNLIGDGAGINVIALPN
jgi:FkbM family methyltransferase